VAKEAASLFELGERELDILQAGFVRVIAIDEDAVQPGIGERW
jgi:hypothetical protein